MNKVIFSAATALTLAVVFTGAASARSGGWNNCGRGCPTPTPVPTPESVITVENKDTEVNTEAKSIADTGENMQFALGSSAQPTSYRHHSSGATKPSVTQEMYTGNAWAGSVAVANVNSTYLPDCGCYVPNGTHELKVENTDTRVTTEALSVAKTGENMQMGATSMNKYQQPKSFDRHSHGGYQPSVAVGGGVKQVLWTGNAASESEAQSWVNMTDMSVAR